MKPNAAKLISIVISLIAVFFVTTACLWIGHRPEVPAELLKK